MAVTAAKMSCSSTGNRVTLGYCGVIITEGYEGEGGGMTGEDLESVRIVGASAGKSVVAAMRSERFGRRGTSCTDSFVVAETGWCGMLVQSRRRSRRGNWR